MSKGLEVALALPQHTTEKLRGVNCDNTGSPSLLRVRMGITTLPIQRLTSFRSKAIVLNRVFRSRTNASSSPCLRFTGTKHANIPFFSVWKLQAIDISDSLASLNAHINAADLEEFSGDYRKSNVCSLRVQSKALFSEGKEDAPNNASYGCPKL